MNLFASLASFEIVQTCNLLLTFTGLLDRNLHTKLTECRCLPGGVLLCCTICVHIACITHGAMEEGREGRKGPPGTVITTNTESVRTLGQQHGN